MIFNEFDGSHFTADSINSQLYSFRLISIPSSGYSRFAAPLFRPRSSRILINPGIINPTRATWQLWSTYFRGNNWKSWEDRFSFRVLETLLDLFFPSRRKEDDWLIDGFTRSVASVVLISLYEYVSVLFFLDESCL